MQRESLRNLESLAEHDPVSRPLARLQLEALNSATDPVWEASSPKLPTDPPAGEVPAIHNQTIPIDVDAAASLLNRLITVLEDDDAAPPSGPAPALRELNPIALIKATIEWDADTFESLALDAGVELPIVATLGVCASLPLMLSCGRRIMSADSEPVWSHGYCPVCASWPLIAEQRGLDRQLWLRCGRCSSAWRSRHQRCIFCDNTDHTTLGYMAAEGERESRRSVTCSVCHSYLKVFASVSPFPIADILRHDLDSLELDMAAIDEGYNRPDTPGYPLQVHLQPAEGKTRSWFSWS